MELTYAKTRADLEEIADLIAKTFVRRSYFDFYDQRMRYQEMDPWFKPERSRIIREGGRIVSHISIIEKRVWIGPAEVKVAGIGDVCTHPRARGKGYARLLMEDALRYMAEHGYPMSMLYGIPNFYHKFGYIEAVRDTKWLLYAHRIPEPAGEYRLRPMRAGDLPALMDLYRRNFSGLNLCVIRNEAYWHRVLPDLSRVQVLLDGSGKVCGYAHLKDDITGAFVVNEAAALNRDAGIALLHKVWLLAPEPRPVRLEVRLSPRAPLAAWLADLSSEWHIRTFGAGEGQGMLALISLRRALEALAPVLSQRLKRSYYSGLTGRLIIQTEQGRENLVLDRGDITIGEAYSANIPGLGGLKTDSRFFVRNLVGFWSIPSLLQSGQAGVRGKEAEALLAVLFPEDEPFMLPLDYF